MATSLRFAGGTKPDGAWHYWRPSGSGIVELGIVRGRDVSLPPHFHDEDQLTFVLSGRRRFVMGGALFDVGPGEGVEIPAGTPHRSLAEPADVVCLNIYTAPGACEATALFSGLVRLWRPRTCIDWRDLTAAVEDFRVGAAMPPHPADSAGVRWETVGEAADLAGMSREGFSRRFRRLYGMPPQMFRLSGKLNEARRLLRVGQAVADVAAETGFSDQSHLGRCFRRAFGVTPGRYRRGIPQTP
ncbi:AraC family transcriptional regulator [Azospirillum sp. YIM B02556]|uniref:AraC family transcriptional regulator n=1 Tax=Azospirillum endophyticum TaxID=2800326 RepID=A0ABS1F9S8_9PROT|nr:AraC family transcriptional regulator [Azospirillum endophyticum]MBK1840187.1 AraC family transcriptional regulator [Azospirillum endophyticum]